MLSPGPSIVHDPPVCAQHSRLVNTRLEGKACKKGSASGGTGLRHGAEAGAPAASSSHEAARVTDAWGSGGPWAGYLLFLPFVSLALCRPKARP
jgi:hypothetical protein